MMQTEVLVKLSASVAGTGKQNRKRYEKFIALNKDEAIQNLKSNSLVNFVENKDEILNEFNAKVKKIQIEKGIIKEEKKKEYKEKDPYDYEILEIAGVQSNSVKCNTPDCGKTIWFDKRCVHKTLRNEQTGKRSLVTLESPYQVGMPKPRRHYCIRGHFIDQDSIKNYIPISQEAVGHVLLHQQTDHCNICKKMSFWLMNYLKEHPEARRLKGKWYD